MRTRAKFVQHMVKFSLNNIKKLEVKFDPFHPNAGSVREFYHGATTKRIIKTNPQCIFKANVVCDNSDPTVTVQFIDDHKLVLNSKNLESNHLAQLITRFSQIHQNEPDD